MLRHTHRSLQFAPMNQPIRGNSRGEHQQRQQIDDQDKQEAAASTNDPVPGFRRIKNQQKHIDHLSRTVITRRLGIRQRKSKMIASLAARLGFATTALRPRQMFLSFWWFSIYS